MSPRPRKTAMAPTRVGGHRTKSSVPRTIPAAPQDLERQPAGLPAHDILDSHYALHSQENSHLAWTDNSLAQYPSHPGNSFDEIHLEPFPMVDNTYMASMLTMNECYGGSYISSSPGQLSEALTGSYHDSMLQDPTIANPSLTMGMMDYHQYPQADVRHGLLSPPADPIEVFPIENDDISLDPRCDLNFQTLPDPAMAESYEKTPSTGLRRQQLSQLPRPIRSASERSAMNQSILSPQDMQFLRDERTEKVKARNDHRYEHGPDKNGYYHCPMIHDGTCNHKPTKQKCIYAKYLDSHLKPYVCKGYGKDCENLRFSSNACLFRHEREAHGLHNHGMNPYLCLYPGCERAREDSGFPRRWNQRDHMKRVHDWIEPDMDDAVSHKYGSTETSRRRKGAGNSNGVQMRRSSSSHAKAQAATYAHGSRQSLNVSRHYALDKQLRDCNIAAFPVSMSELQYAQPTACEPRTSPYFGPSYPQLVF